MPEKSIVNDLYSLSFPDEVKDEANNLAKKFPENFVARKGNRSKWLCDLIIEAYIRLGREYDLAFIAKELKMTPRSSSMHKYRNIIDSHAINISSAESKVYALCTSCDKLNYTEEITAAIMKTARRIIQKNKYLISDHKPEKVAANLIMYHILTNDMKEDFNCNAIFGISRCTAISLIVQITDIDNR